MNRRDHFEQVLDRTIDIGLHAAIRSVGLARWDDVVPADAEGVLQNYVGFHTPSRFMLHAQLGVVRRRIPL